MQPKTIIFIGPQGSGKGTQVELLREKLITADKGCFVTHIQTGKPFRELAAAGGYTADLVKKLIDNGKFVPDVLTNALVVTEFVNQHVEGAHVLMDGYPRNEAQAKTFMDLLDVYKRPGVDVFHLDTEENVVIERMLERGREDDNEEAIAERLRRYREVTEPLLAFYSKEDNATVHTINGGQTIEEVQVQICNKLGI